MSQTDTPMPVTGRPALARYLTDLMNSRLAGMHAYDPCEQEALSVNHLHALALIHECRQADLNTIDQIRGILARDFTTEGEQYDQEAPHVENTEGGALLPRADGELDDPHDQAVDDSFPASDPPTYSRTSLG
jgi:hypothetical protein